MYVFSKCKDFFKVGMLATHSFWCPFEFFKAQHNGVPKCIGLKMGSLGTFQK